MAGPGRESGRTDPPLSADGKLYDAYISYSNSPEDRKFVNFILKPQLERHRGYKLFLDDRDLLPRAGTGAPPLSAWAPPPLVTDPASKAPPLRSSSAQAPPLQGPRPVEPSAPFHWAPPLSRCSPRPRWSQTPPSKAPPLKSSSAPGPSPPRLGLRPLPGPRPSRAQSVLPPLMPGSCRAVGRPAGEPEPLPATCAGVVGCLPGPGLVQSQLPVGPALGWVGLSRARSDCAALAGRACAGCWSSRADPSSSPSRASGATPRTLHCACCASTATW